MAFEWTEKENKRNIIYAEDINSMAREVIRLENDKANKSNSLFGYGIEDAYTTKEADEIFAKKSTTLKDYGIEDAYTKEESDGKFAFKEIIYTKSEIDEKIKADITPTENSTNLITSGGVYEALQKMPSGGTQPPFVFACELEMSYDGKWSVTSSTNYEEIVSSFQKGQTVIAQAILLNGTTSTMSTANLLCLGEKGNYMPGHLETIPYIFNGVTSSGEFVSLEWYTFMSADKRTIKVIEATSKEYVDTAIGDVETSLENIINKYGLGGEA